MDAQVKLTATFDALRRRRLDELRGIAASYPELLPEVAARRTLGAQEVVPSELGASAAVALFDIAAREARRDLDDVLSVLAHRTRLLARIRISSAAISATTTAGLVGLILGSTRRGQVTVSVIAFLSALLSLGSTYIEDFSGGDGSTRRLRETMLTQVRSLAEAENRGKLARVTANSDGVVAGLVAVNAVFAEVQYARAMLGMPVSSG